MMNVIDQRITNYEANYIFKLVDTSKVTEIYSITYLF